MEANTSRLAPPGTGRSGVECVFFDAVELCAKGKKSRGKRQVRREETTNSDLCQGQRSDVLVPRMVRTNSCSSARRFIIGASSGPAEVDEEDGEELMYESGLLRRSQWKSVVEG